MRKINEIFYSLQGEGFHTGTPALFIRFSGCNLKCEFCDTQHETGSWMSDDEIIRRAEECPAKMVVLTGGEPSLWIDEELIHRLHAIEKYVCPPSLKAKLPLLTSTKLPLPPISVLLLS